MATYRPLEDRFWEKVQKTDGCWWWIGCTYKKGHGYMNLGRDYGNRRMCAHRISLWLSGVELSEDMDTHHECMNPACVRPDHLKLVTRSEHGFIHSPWNRETVISAIHDFHRQFGVAPAATDWNPAYARAMGHHQRVERFHKNNWPSFTTVQNLFGSWSKGLEAAGFSSGIGRRGLDKELPRVLSS